MSAEVVVVHTRSFECHAHHDVDEARIRVVRDKPEEQALVHVWGSKECGARLVRDDDELRVMSHTIPTSARSSCMRAVTHEENGVNCPGLDEQRKRPDYPRVGSTAVEHLAEELPMRPASESTQRTSLMGQISGRAAC